LYYGWVNLVVAAIAMTATLPGRTHGLGLITESLRADLDLNRVAYGALNGWAIVLGAALCWPAGRLIDRLGSRPVLVGVALGLGASVLWMSTVDDWFWLFITLTLVRGLGQGALSVVSLALIGKWFRRRLGLAMGLYSVLLAIGFIVSILALGGAMAEYGWRGAWAGLGWWLLLGLAPLGFLLARSTPESCGLALEDRTTVSDTSGGDLTLGKAFRTPVFWTSTLAIACFNLTWSAVTLYYQSILAEQGLDRPVDVGGKEVDLFVLVMAAMTATGLLANLLAGWLATHWPLPRLLALGMLLFGLAVLVYPSLNTPGQAVLHGAAMGVCGGLIVVAYFALYPRLFGRTYLGQIQAVVQVASVLASALGPWLLALCGEKTGSYHPLFFSVAGVAALLGALVWLSPQPRREPRSAAAVEVESS
jgi:MFS family permease